MLDELTPLQAYELCCYHAKEPFGEVRQDLRMANWIQFYYDSKRGRKGRDIALGQFTLYDDIKETSTESADEESLLRALGGG